MQDGFERLSLVRVGKNDGPHSRPVKAAIGSDDSIAELPPNVLQRGRAGPHNLARDDISIDNRCPQLAKMLGDGRFTARDAAREANTQHAGHF